MKQLIRGLFIVLVASNALGQSQPWLQYAAKFVCGTSPPDADIPPLIAKGRYYTQINVHNPSRYQTVAFRKKFAIALAFEKGGPISPFFPAALKADEALQVDCGDILDKLHINPFNGYAEGYAVIETPLPLDVVSVYTAGSGAGHDVSSIHTERVEPRRLEVCGPLDFNITTGKADWRIVGSGAPANVYGLFQNGPAYVIGAAPTSDQNKVVPMSWELQLLFCACSGGQPRLELKSVWLDDQLEFTLNGHAIGTLPLNPSSAAISAINSNATPWFQGGQNELRVKLTNIWPPGAGFALAGSITGADAACPNAPLP